MSGFKNDLTSFYKFTTPIDLLGQVQLKDLQGKKSTSQLTEDIISLSIKDGNLSSTIVERCSNEIRLKNAVIAGFFNCLRQGKGRERIDLADSHYWGTKKDVDPQNPSTNFDTQLSKVQNYYLNVCHAEVPSPTNQPTGTPTNNGPPIDFAVNIFRAPMLSLARVNVDEVEFFLNNMPPIFANQLVPYCDVEFQLPQLKQLTLGKGESEIGAGFVNRPSLYRFLVGSGAELNSLTEADKSLAAFVKPTSPSLQTKKSNTTAYVGTEYFTTPQTLTNMDKLRKGPNRVNDVKPFLPPATMTGINITVKNLGAAFYAGRTAQLTMKIHDKARLPEFSEFIRGPQGYNDVTIWITYGLLAPRGRGDDDAYAKFINENMLVREGYSVTNATFSFANDGSVDVTMTLYYKTKKRLDFATINATDSDLRAKLDRVKNLFASAAEKAGAFGAPREANRGYTTSEIRIGQLIANAAQEDLDPGAEPDKLAGQFKEVRDILKAEKNKRSKNREDVDPDAALKLLSDLEQLYTPGQKSLREQIKIASKNFVQKKFQQARLVASPDPFFPSSRKNEQRTSVDQKKSPITDVVCSDKFISTCVLKNPNAKRPYLSFGKLFSVFCIPSVLASTKQEFGSVDGGASDVEVQFNFYQLNGLCGPASNHNIAEFPIDMQIFEDSLAKQIEKRGGENFTIDEFLSFMAEQFVDPRQPGYGMRGYYNNYDSKQPEAKPKGGPDSMKKWYDEYVQFKEPSLALEVEVFEEKQYKSKSDLLYKLQNRVGGEFTNTVVTSAKKDSKIIVRYHIYDRAATPYEKLIPGLSVDKDGAYYLFNSDVNPSTVKYGDDKKPSYSVENGAITVGGQVVAKSIGQGKEALRESLGSAIPKLDIGGNGSLIYSAQLASKSGALEGTVALQGGAYKVNPGLTPNGLAMQQNNMAMTVMPAQLSMSTMGCPIARPYQQFFIDFGTNTTLDNCYSVTQLQHNITPGKFETNWTFTYTDGYATLRSAGSVSSYLENLKKSLSTKSDAAPPKPQPGVR